MEKRRSYAYSGEFSPNGNGIFYPAYMPLEDLTKFAFEFVHQLLGAPEYAEVKVSRVDGGLGLSWQILEFREDADDKKIVWLSRKYSFCMASSWKISMSKDQ